MRAWIQAIAATNDENRTRVAVAFALLLLLPWLMIITRAGTEIATDIIGILFLWRSVARRDWRWLRAPIMMLAVIAWVWLMVGVSPFALNPEKSFLLALPWIRYMLLFAAMRYWLMTTPASVRVVAGMLVALVAFCTIDTLWQYATGVSLTGNPISDSGRLTGPFVGTKIGIFMAKFLLPTLAIISVVLTVRAPYAFIAVALGTVLAIAAILLTGERTAFGMTVAALVMGGVLVIRREKRVLPYALGMFALMCACVVLLFLTQDWVHLTLERTVATLEHFEQSPYGQVFAAALHTGRDHWLTGVGMQGFRIAYESMVAAQGPEAMGEHFMHTHNTYLEWFAEAGLVGLLLMISIVVCLLREAWQMLRMAQGMAVMAPALVLGTLLFNFFPFMSTQSYFSNWTGIVVWYTLGLAFSVKPRHAAAIG